MSETLLALVFPDRIGTLIQPSVAKDMLSFCLGYALILAIPGPNTILIATNAAALGFRRTLPLIMAIGLGAVTLMVALGILVGFSRDQQDVIGWMPLASAGLLVMVAYRIASLKPSGGSNPRFELGGWRSAMAVGFLCGVTNPVTASFFLSQYLTEGKLTAGPALIILALGVLGTAVLLMASLARLLAVAGVQDAVRRHFARIRMAAATLVLLMALQSLWRFMPPEVAGG
jgi:threonine/homoserine/homoserine lactone efflux protein